MNPLLVKAYWYYSLCLRQTFAAAFRSGNRFVRASCIDVRLRPQIANHERPQGKEEGVNPEYQQRRQRAKHQQDKNTEQNLDHLADLAFAAEDLAGHMRIG